MEWNNPDALPGETEEEYEDRVKRESQSSIDLMFTIINILFFALKIAAIFGIFFYTGFFLSQKLYGEEAGKFKVWGFALLFTYLIFSIIYFLKGIIIGLRARKRMLWMLPWAICVLLCCITPAYIVKSLIAGMFNPIQQEGLLCIGVSWGVFVIFSFYIYGLYQFKTPTAPNVYRWSYALGLKISS